MSFTNETVKAEATDPLDKVYNINERIKKLQGDIEKLQQKNSRKGKATDNAIAHRIEDLNVQIAALIHERTQELKKVRWSEKRPQKIRPAPKEERIPSPVSVISEPEPEPIPVPRVPTPVPAALDRVLIPCKLKVTGMKIGTNSTSLTMAPTWFKPDDTQSAMQGVVHPDKPIDRQQLTTLARFRTSIGKSKDFRMHPVDMSERSTEVLVLSLDAFAQQYGGQLSFTNRDLSFDSSAENAACGVPNLGSAHLLANDNIPTAQFSFCLALDYDRQLAISPDRMQNFVVNFCAAIAQALGCKSDYVRVFSVDKSPTDPGMVDVSFGLTTPVLEDTKSLVIKLQDLAKNGFGENEILRLCQLREYECQWRSVLSYLEIKSSDFDPRFNFDYTQPNLPTEQQRANTPYYLPLGWFRHGLNVSQKYSGDPTWLGHNNSPGEWPVAFHGTHPVAASSIVERGLALGVAKRDLMLGEAIRQKGPEVNRPGLYLATHCNGGSEGYATTFTVKNGDVDETYQVVFQCRVRPDSFTVHTSCVKIGHGWRVVDPTAVRPYGLLLRKQNV